MANRVVVLLSDEELAEVKRRAGLVPLSAWFRNLAFSIPAMDRALNLHAKAQMEFTAQHVRADTSDRPIREKRIAALAAWEDAKTAALRRGEADEFPKYEPRPQGVYVGSADPYSQQIDLGKEQKDERNSITSDEPLGKKFDVESLRAKVATALDGSRRSQRQSSGESWKRGPRQKGDKSR